MPVALEEEPMRTQRTPLTGRICHVLGHEPRTRQEIALAAGYDGHGQVLSEALAELVASGEVVRTPAGWHATLWPPSNAEGCAAAVFRGSVLAGGPLVGVRRRGVRTRDDRSEGGEGTGGNRVQAPADRGSPACVDHALTVSDVLVNR